MNHSKAHLAHGAPAPVRVRRGAPLALLAAAILALTAPAAALAGGGKSGAHKPAGAGTGKRIR